MMGGVTILQNYHNFNSIVAEINWIDVPANGSTFTLGRARVGSDWQKVYGTQDMNIEVNGVALDAGFSTADFADTIFHEWLHRIAYVHPDGYEGAAINEAGLCIATNNSKQPGAKLSGKPYVVD